MAKQTKRKRAVDHGRRLQNTGARLADDIREVRKYFRKGDARAFALLRLEMLISSAKHFGWIVGFREGCGR